MDIRVLYQDEISNAEADELALAAHRNRGVGRWLKADMWQWLRHDRPDVEHLDTGNAESNRAMLSINEAMGFQAILHIAVWHSSPA